MSLALRCLYVPVCSAVGGAFYGTGPGGSFGSYGMERLETAAEDALLQLQALHHTRREATRLFLLAVREGATDAQIAHALLQGLPHLTDPASLQDRRAGKEPEGTGTSEKGK